MTFRPSHLTICLLILLLASACRSTSADETAPPTTTVPTIPAVDVTLGDPAAGAALFSSPSLGCVACHTIEGVSTGPVGPNLTSIAVDIESRLAAGEYTGEAVDVASYLLESLVLPDAFIAPVCPTGACPSGAMPATVVESLSSQELADLVSYLASLN